jgi:hypothetical protein
MGQVTAQIGIELARSEDRRSPHCAARSVRRLLPGAFAAELEAVRPLRLRCLDIPYDASRL